MSTEVEQSLSQELINSEIDVDHISLLVEKAVEHVEKSDLSGPEKKAAVINSLGKVIDGADIDTETRKYLHLAVQTIVPQMVDVLVKASKGDIDINSHAQVAAKCCLGFF